MANRGKPYAAQWFAAAVHALFLGQYPQALEFERFVYLYTAIDACFALIKGLTGMKGPATHAERIEWMWGQLRITTPPWARRVGKSDTVVSTIRNAAVHEALFAGEPEQEQDLRGPLATLPVALRLSKTPDDPLHLACRGGSGAAPRPNTPRASSVSMISRLTEPLHHTLSTLHDGRCRTPCKTRFRLAGCAFAGRGVEPAGSQRKVSVHVIPLSRAYPVARALSDHARSYPAAAK